MTQPPLVKREGFTLVELLVAMTLSIVVILAIYTVYINQIHAANAQERILTMRQNWRAAHFGVGQELMKAGYSSKLGSSLKPGFIEASKSAMKFSYVDDTSGTLIEESLALVDQNQDGHMEVVRTTAPAGNTTASVARVIADNIETLEFIYALDNNQTTWTPSATEMKQIHGVRVTVVARTLRQVSGYPTPKSLSLPFPTGESSNEIAYSDDGIYRQMVTGFFKCRNIAHF